MKRTDKEVQEEALTAYQKNLYNERKLQEESHSHLFEELKERLPDLQTDSKYKFYLGGYEFSMHTSSVMRWNGSEWRYALSPHLRSKDTYTLVYDMASFGRFLVQEAERKEKEEKKQEQIENEKKSLWQRINHFFAFNYE